MAEFESEESANYFEERYRTVAPPRVARGQFLNHDTHWAHVCYVSGALS